MVFDFYLFRALLVASILTALTLAGIILLTQSLRFLELVIGSGASSLSFWILTALALPRFFEVILPIALMIGTIFVYNRMNTDSEAVAMRAGGASPLKLAAPALTLAIGTTVLLLFITTWLAPVSLANMHQMRQVIKAQYSALLFREGVFTSAGKHLTVYIGERADQGELRDLIIHDSRPELESPVTILAESGIIVETDGQQQVVVYRGSRQVQNRETGALNRLDFERYTVDLPGEGPVRQRWREPEERSFLELLNPDPSVARDMESRHDFWVEAHKRIVSPFLALTFTLIALVFLLLGPHNRRGQNMRIFAAVMMVIVFQGIFLGLYNLSAHSGWGLVLMYLLAIAPIAGGVFALSPQAEKLRHALLYQRGRA